MNGHFRLNHPRSLVILGSTGSIGTSALRVIRNNPGDFKIAGLAGARNTRLLAAQANEFRPKRLAVLDSDLAAELRELLDPGYHPEILAGTSGYQELAGADDADLVLSAMVGAAGLLPTLTAVEKGKVVLLANKESLVLAGPLIRDMCGYSGSVVLPVDSEHNALFQALQGHRENELDSVIITASGGPFWGWDASQLNNITPQQAVAHPNWSMGAKISVDSATMMNKGLELIEAHHLFGLDIDKLRVLVHPQSIVHALVQFRDGSLLAHMGQPDMQLPIAHCLGYPDRPEVDLEPLDLTRAGELTFFHPDQEAFPCLDLAVSALKSGPSHAVVLNAANEVCVESFLSGKIGFMDIPRLNSRALEIHEPRSLDSADAILELDSQVRARMREWIKTDG